MCFNNTADDTDYDSADTHCVHCGAAIYFEVGFFTKCPNCGKNYERSKNIKYETSRTDEEMLDDEINSIIFSLEMRRACMSKRNVIKKIDDIKKYLESFL